MEVEGDLGGSGSAAAVLEAAERRRFEEGVEEGVGGSGSGSAAAALDLAERRRLEEEEEDEDEDEEAFLPPFFLELEVEGSLLAMVKEFGFIVLSKFSCSTDRSVGGGFSMEDVRCRWQRRAEFSAVALAACHLQ